MNKATTIRFDEEDIACLDRLKKLTKMRSIAPIVRFALEKLEESYKGS